MASDAAVIFVALLNRAPNAAEPEQIAKKAVHYAKILRDEMEKADPPPKK